MAKKIIASGYTDGYIVGLEGKTGNPGISIYDFDPAAGKLHLAGFTAESENPSFLCVGKTGVTAVCERVKTCFVEGYRFLPGNGLEKTGSVAVPGTAMCHITRWPDQRFASVSNYMTGDFAVIRMEDERPVELLSQHQHQGVGFDKAFRQEGPHVHSTLVSPGGQYLLVADLGLDQVFIYKIDPKTGSVEIAPESAQLHTPPGTGPRHMAFSPDGKYFYLVTEMGCRLFAYAWSEQQARFTFLEEYPLLPEGFEGSNLSADIHISPDGTRVYASNRGADDIVVFSRDTATGCLQLLAHHQLAGQGPRNFCLDKGMAYMAVACQNSGALLVYALQKDGVPGTLLAKAGLPQASYCSFLE